MIEKMNERQDEERKADASGNRISLADAVAAAAQMQQLKNDAATSFNSLNSQTGDISGFGSLDPMAFLQRQQQDQGQNLFAARFLFQQQQQQQQQQQEALRTSLFGGLLGNTSATRAGLEQATMFQNQQIDFLRSRLMYQQPDEASVMMSAMPQQRLGKNTQEVKKGMTYQDASQLPEPPSDDEDEDSLEGSEGNPEADAKKAAKAATETFPQKLYRMIEEAEKDDMKDVVSFFSHGRAFCIHKPRKFISDLMPKYFSTSRMSSFQRQLNLYGFKRITEGRDKGGYFHEFFLKGRKGLCKKVKRKKTAAPAKCIPQNPSGGLSALQAQLGSNTGGFFGGLSRQMTPGLQDAANLFQMQMLGASAGGFGGGGSLGGLASNDMSALNHRFNAGSNFRGGGIEGMDQETLTAAAMLEKTKTELLMAQLQLQQQQLQLQQQRHQSGNNQQG